jgi:FkbM family methyltransferase
MKKITSDNYIKNFFEQRYRDFVLKPALKIINKHQAKSELIFWTMPFDTICKNITLNKFYEAELLNGMCELANNKDSIAIDIGANIGNHSLFFANKFKQVIAFEPVPSNCWIVKSNAYLNKIDNLILIEKGLSNKNTQMAVDTSNRENTNNGISQIIKNSNNQIVVDIVIVDEEIEKLKLSKKIEIIKIDVEGHEPFVVEGLKKTIEKNKPLIFWEAFSRDEVNKTKVLLEQGGYRYFYHITPNRFSNKFFNKLWKSVSKATYLIKMDQCQNFDGMNVASIKEL